MIGVRLQLVLAISIVKIDVTCAESTNSICPEITVHTVESQLVCDLLKKHPPSWTLPVKGEKASFPLSVHLNLTQLMSLNEAENSLTLTYEMEIVWNDDYVRWDLNSNSTSTEVNFPVSSIWYPDLLIYHRNKDYYHPERKLTSIKATANGKMQLHISEKVVVSCNDFDFKMYPFDTQKCKINFWLTSDYYMLAGFVSVSADKPQYFLPNSEFDRTLLQVEIRHSGKSFSLQISMTRKPTLIVSTLIVPMVIVTAFSVLSFLLPPDSETKIEIQITVMLTYAIYMDAISKTLPSTKEEPMIVRKVTALLLANFMFTFITLLVLRLTKISHTSVPRSIKKVTDALGVILLLKVPPKCSSVTSPKLNIPEDDDNERATHKLERLIQQIMLWLGKLDEENAVKGDWYHVGGVIDRITFFLGMLFFVWVSLSIFTPILHHQYQSA